MSDAEARNHRDRKRKRSEIDANFMAEQSLSTSLAPTYLINPVLRQQNVDNALACLNLGAEELPAPEVLRAAYNAKVAASEVLQAQAWTQWSEQSPTDDEIAHLDYVRAGIERSYALLKALIGPESPIVVKEEDSEG